jgi:hypothetical protein
LLAGESNAVPGLTYSNALQIEDANQKQPPHNATGQTARGKTNNNVSLATSTATHTSCMTKLLSIAQLMLSIIAIALHATILPYYRFHMYDIAVRAAASGKRHHEF